MTIRFPFIAAVACAAALGACGGGDDDTNESRFEGEEAEVAAVIDRLTTAAREEDAKTICEDLITENLQISIRRAAGTSCAAEVGENIFAEDAEFRAEDIAVTEDTATAEVVDQHEQRSNLLFERDGESWRIARIGPPSGTTTPGG
jgi:hypothetical protein